MKEFVQISLETYDSLKCNNEYFRTFIELLNYVKGEERK